MRKTRRSKSHRGVTDRSATTDVVTQLVCAFKNPHASAMGAVIGGLVPWFGRTLAHEEIPSTWSGGQHGLAIAMIAVVIGCACFSAISVYKFGRAAFGDARKALGFVLALEGVMLVSQGTTSAVALAILIAINAIANGSVIALSRDATRRRCEADARRAATRALRHGGADGVRNRTIPRRAPDVPARGRPVAARSARPVVITPAWYQDVVDAEIVSEQKLLS